MHFEVGKLRTLGSWAIWAWIMTKILPVISRMYFPINADRCTGSSYAYKITSTTINMYRGTGETWPLGPISSQPFLHVQADPTLSLHGLTTSEVLPKDADESGCPPASCSFKERKGDIFGLKPLHWPWFIMVYHGLPIPIPQILEKSSIVLA